MNSSTEIKTTDYTICDANTFGYCSGDIFGTYNNVNICTFHNNLLSKYSNDYPPTELSSSPITYYFEKMFNSCLLNDKYTFWYCKYHDKGYFIKDHITDEVPAWCKMCTPEGGKAECDESDWQQLGIINYNGKDVLELEAVQVKYYSQFPGGFNFLKYAEHYHINLDTHIDSHDLLTGNEGENKDYMVKIPEDSPLKRWFLAKTIL